MIDCRVVELALRAEPLVDRAVTQTQLGIERPQRHRVEAVRGKRAQCRLQDLAIAVQTGTSTALDGLFEVGHAHAPAAVSRASASRSSLTGSVPSPNARHPTC